MRPRFWLRVAVAFELGLPSHFEGKPPADLLDEAEMLFDMMADLPGLPSLEGLQVAAAEYVEAMMDYRDSYMCLRAV